MKKIVLLAHAVVLCGFLSAQQFNFKSAPEPAPQPASATETHQPQSPVYPQPLYYNDVIIQNSATIDQRRVRISVAFNGWLYAAFSTTDLAGGSGGMTICSSRDNGQTWTVIDSYSIPSVSYPAFDIVVCGTDTNNLTLYHAGINHATSGNYVLFVDRYNATTGVFINSNFNQQNGTRPIYDVALASDYRYPSVSSSPYSVGLLYSTYSASTDSINFLGSVDGGGTWTVRQNVAVTGYYNRNVSLAYGRSMSASNGRYFAAWEQIGSQTARTGHIYTSRNTSSPTSAWITPVNLDSVSASMINLCCNPQIAVQFNNTDNDSSSCTAVVLVQRDYTTTGSDYDLLGFYNKRAHFTSFWNRLDIVNSAENDLQPDISYDPANDNFLGVYYDSTNGHLPYIVNGMNLTTPSAWTSITNQYNDNTTNLRSAWPRVEINPLVTQAAHAWIAEGVVGNGVAMFDAEYVITTANNNAGLHGGNAIAVFPNPAGYIINIQSNMTGNAVLNMYNSLGELVESRQVILNGGGNGEQVDVGSWSNGMYTAELISGSQRQTTRFAVAH